MICKPFKMVALEPPVVATTSRNPRGALSATVMLAVSAVAELTVTLLTTTPVDPPYSAPY